MAPNKMYEQIPRHRFEILRSRCDVFSSRMSDPDTEVIKVFDTLGPKLQEELNLIREVSRELQQKKEEDMLKAAQAAEEAAKEAEAKAELEKKEEAAAENKENEAETETPTDAVEVDKVEK